ncbi:hypothetical protein [Fervidibacillus albus]|uniref:Uncharacterized protein n=1 Tax=Fervidibacillus albus TaxID=2980026 RepID=A0A9E8LSB8_9BACI|nr:hypothetical protein [Fervidibacillus albus]WAA08663.1 hypothetical protein OE104_08385 [Fervidibacillus albus]
MKNIILGSLGTLGFDLSKRFLELGEAVFHINIGDEFLDEQKLEEKKMLFGRNCNFQERCYTEILEAVEGGARIIVPLIDWERFDERKKQIVTDRLILCLERLRNMEIPFFTFISQKKDIFEKLKTNLSSIFSQQKRIQIITVPEQYEWMNRIDGEEQEESDPLIEEIFALIDRETHGEHQLIDKLKI